VRVLLGDQVFRSPRSFFVFEEAGKCARGVLSSGADLLYEVRPRRAGGLVVCKGL